MVLGYNSAIGLATSAVPTEVQAPPTPPPPPATEVPPPPPTPPTESSGAWDEGRASLAVGVASLTVALA